MITDIRINTSFRNHGKRKKLQKILGIAPSPTDYLIDLWIATAQNHPTGKLDGMDALDIALAAGWEGDPDVFVEALVSCRFLDLKKDVYHVHDWDEHQEYVVNAPKRKKVAREAASKRWDAAQNKKSEKEKQKTKNKKIKNSDDEKEAKNDQKPSKNDQKTIENGPKNETTDFGFPETATASDKSSAENGGKRAEKSEVVSDSSCSEQCCLNETAMPGAMLNQEKSNARSNAKSGKEQCSEQCCLSERAMPGAMLNQEKSNAPSLALPSLALPSLALPSLALPSLALPSLALPSQTIPDQTQPPALPGLSNSKPKNKKQQETELDTSSPRAESDPAVVSAASPPPASAAPGQPEACGDDSGLWDGREIKTQAQVLALHLEGEIREQEPNFNCGRERWTRFFEQAIREDERFRDVPAVCDVMSWACARPFWLMTACDPELFVKKYDQIQGEMIADRLRKEKKTSGHGSAQKDLETMARVEAGIALAARRKLDEYRNVFFEDQTTQAVLDALYGGWYDFKVAELRPDTFIEYFCKNWIAYKSSGKKSFKPLMGQVGGWHSQKEAFVGDESTIKERYELHEK